MRLASIAAAACAAIVALPLAFASGPTPVHWSLTAKLAKGGHATAHLHATIEAGWHLYALDQAPGGPVATRISVAPHQGFTLGGDIDESAPHTAMDPNFNLKTRFFEDTASFTIPLREAGAGASKVTVDVRYQTCNDHICLPPRVEHVTARVAK